MSNRFMDDDRFDGLYLNVAQQARGIEPLLDTVFSFLRRKTDFFDGPNGDSTLAFKKVEEVFSKHAQLYQQSKSGSSSKKKSVASKPKPKPSTTKAPDSKPAAPAKAEEPVIEMGSDGGFDVSSAEKQRETPKPTAVPEAQSPPAPSAKDTKSNNSINEKTDDQPSNDDDDKKSLDSKALPPLGNGGTEPGKYVWTQTLQEVTVNIPVPDGTRGRDLTVVIGKKHLKVGVKGQQEMIVDAPLTKTVIIDDSFWTVEDGNRCVVQLQKLNDHEWWNSVCEGHSSIDVTTIQPESSSLADLDGETRKTVEKMMYDQRQKAMGLPSSDEESKMAALERFKAQHPEMDFSNAKINF